MARQMKAQDVKLGKELYAQGKDTIEVSYLLKVSDTTARKIRDGHYDHLLEGERPQEEKKEPQAGELYEIIYAAVKRAFKEVLDGDQQQGKGS